MIKKGREGGSPAERERPWEGKKGEGCRGGGDGRRGPAGRGAKAVPGSRAGPEARGALPGLGQQAGPQPLPAERGFCVALHQACEALLCSPTWKHVGALSELAMFWKSTRGEEQTF